MQNALNNWEWWRWVLLIISTLYSGVVFSFLVWRTRKSEYDNEEIFLVTLNVLLISFIFALIGSVIGGGILPLWLGLLVALIYSSVRHEKPFWEWGDSIAWQYAFAVMLPILVIGDLLRIVEIFLIFILTLFVFSFYRQFRWYKSGWPGLALSCATLVVFLGESVVALMRSSSLYFVTLAGLSLSVLAIIARASKKEFKIKKLTLWTNRRTKRRK